MRAMTADAQPGTRTASRRRSAGSPKHECVLGYGEAQYANTRERSEQRA